VEPFTSSVVPDSFEYRLKAIVRGQTVPTPSGLPDRFNRNSRERYSVGLAFEQPGSLGKRICDSILKDWGRCVVGLHGLVEGRIDEQPALIYSSGPSLGFLVGYEATKREP
jgi:hypothetical protein